MPSSIAIDANFPGGNIIVERIEGYRAWVRQDLRDTECDWFYWYCRVRPEPGTKWAGENIRLTFTSGDVLGVRGPAIAEHGEDSWRWLGADCVIRDGEGVTVTYRVPHEFSELRLAFCPPYTYADWERFWLDQENVSDLPEWNQLAHSRHVSLGETRSGRSIEAFSSTPIIEPAITRKVLVTARHHACESIGSYTLEGLAAAWYAADEVGEWLRSNVHLFVIPFMDFDGVESGDQGKNRRPHDHNRDYAGEIEDSIYPEVRALRRRLPDWLNGGGRRIALDLHCPWIRGDYHEHVYFVGQSEPRVQPAAQRFSKILESVRTGPLPYEAAGDLPYGQGWNAADNYQQPLASCTARLNSFKEIEFASSFEVPYANASGAVVTPDSARALGRDLALALRAYLL